MEQTDRSQRGGVDGGMEEISQRTYMHVCKAPGHRQQCGKGRGSGGWMEKGKEGDGACL